MPFHYILANLIANNEGSVGALFLDPTGETIDLACTEITPYQMRILGAYLGIHVRQLERVLDSNRLGRGEMLQIEVDGLVVYAVPLPDEYYLILAQRPPARSAEARRQLETAASQIVTDAFA